MTERRTLRDSASVVFVQELPDFANNVLRRAWRDGESHMMTDELDLLVALVIEPARRAWGDEAVAPRPDGEMRHRRLVGDARDRRIIDRVPGHALVELPDI